MTSKRHSIAFAAGLLIVVLTLFGCASQNESNEVSTSSAGTSMGTQNDATVSDEGSSPVSEAGGEEAPNVRGSDMGQKNNASSNITIEVNGCVLTATLGGNSSAQALVEMLQSGPLTVEMSDYGNMEKVGSLGRSLPRNDEQITTQAGDIILYQGDKLVIYYAPNSWDFTRLGRIEGTGSEDLRQVLGSGDVSVILSLA